MLYDDNDEKDERHQNNDHHHCHLDLFDSYLLYSILNQYMMYGPCILLFIIVNGTHIEAHYCTIVQVPV